MSTLLCAPAFARVWACEGDLARRMVLTMSATDPVGCQAPRPLLSWGRRAWFGVLGVCLGLADTALSWGIYHLRGRPDAWWAVGTIAGCGVAGLAIIHRVLSPSGRPVLRWLGSALLAGSFFALSVGVGALFFYHWRLLQWLR